MKRSKPDDVARASALTFIAGIHCQVEGYRRLENSLTFHLKQIRFPCFLHAHDQPWDQNPF